MLGVKSLMTMSRSAVTRNALKRGVTVSTGRWTAASSVKPALTSQSVRLFSEEQKNNNGGFWDILKGKNEAKAEQQSQAQSPATEQQAAQSTAQSSSANGAADAAAAAAAAEAPKYVRSAEDQALFESLQADMAKLKATVSQHEAAIKTHETTIKSHEATIKARENKIQEVHSAYLRELAEQDNIRTRGQKDVQAAKKYGVSSFAKNLVDVADTLELAVAAAENSMKASQENSPSLTSLLDGVKMTSTVFTKALNDAGIVKFESMGKKADPDLHFVAAQLPHPELDPGIITHVAKEGYMIHDRVLRPAQVAVVAPK